MSAFRVFLKLIIRFLLRGFVLLSTLLILFILVLTVASYLRENKGLDHLPFQGGGLVSTNDGQYYSIERGLPGNTPLVLTHGTAAWSGLWLPTMDYLGKNGYRAFSFDMPPFGYSQHAADKDYSRQRQAKRFLAFLAELNVKPIVVAHSFSAGMVAEAAMMNSDAFAGIVFVDAAIGLHSHKNPKTVPIPLQNEAFRRIGTAATISNPLLTGTFLRQFIHVKEGATEPIIEVLKQPMVKRGYTAAVASWLPQLFETPLQAQSTRAEAWKNFPVQTAFLWGDKDTITPLSQANELHGLIKGSSLTILNGIGHIPQVEAPEMFQKELVSVLDTFSQENSQRGTQ